MVTAVTTESNVIMGARHRRYALEAVQYHPESILSEHGLKLISNFLSFSVSVWPSELTGDVFQCQAKQPSILDSICARRLSDLDLTRMAPGQTPQDFKRLLDLHVAPPCISVLWRISASHTRGPALMAEIKRASPSKGGIALTANAAEQAFTYAVAGASVISVLTEPTWFKGCLMDMRSARQVIDHLPNRPAILRKDFILDEYQIVEARLYGADSVLLIVGMLSERRFKELYHYSLEVGMEPLVEVNNESEMHIALEIGAKFIGINNRNLHDFTVNLSTTERLAAMVNQPDILLCSLSGISSGKDVQIAAKSGIHAVLVGEAIMKASEPLKLIRDLLAWDDNIGHHTCNRHSPPFVKVCGITSVEESLLVEAAGADMLGLVFVPSSKRYVPLETACAIAKVVRLSGGSAHSQRSCRCRSKFWFTKQALELQNMRERAMRPLLVGVFQNQSLESILCTVNSVQLDIVQLHGSEPLEWAKHIPVPVIRVARPSLEAQNISAITTPGLHHFLMFDSVSESSKLDGGSGKQIDWRLVGDIVALGETRCMHSPPDAIHGLNFNESCGQFDGRVLPVIIAGGLTASNVQHALELSNAWAVDVSTGVEKCHGGGKDFDKVAAFVAAVKNARS